MNDEPVAPPEIVPTVAAPMAGIMIVPVALPEVEVIVKLTVLPAAIVESNIFIYTPDPGLVSVSCVPLI